MLFSPDLGSEEGAEECWWKIRNTEKNLFEKPDKPNREIEGRGDYHNIGVLKCNLKNYKSQTMDTHSAWPERIVTTDYTSPQIIHLIFLNLSPLPVSLSRINTAQYLLRSSDSPFWSSDEFKSPTVVHVTVQTIQWFEERSGNALTEEKPRLPVPTRPPTQAR